MMRYISTHGVEEFDANGSKGDGDLSRSDHGRHREAVAHRFANDNDVWLRVLRLETPPAAPHPAKPDLHFVRYANSALLTHNPLKTKSVDNVGT
jgi:hypothetical protein